jgi:hypothetical protein
MYAISDTETSLTVPDIPLSNPEPQPNSLISLDVIPSRSSGSIQVAAYDRSGGSISYYSITVYNYSKGAVQYPAVYNKTLINLGVTSINEVIGPFDPSMTLISKVELQSSTMDAPYIKDGLAWTAQTSPSTSDMADFPFGDGVLLIIGLGIPLLTILIMSLISVDMGILLAMIELVIFKRLNFFLNVAFLNKEFASLSMLTWFISIFSLFAVFSLWRKMRRLN